MVNGTFDQALDMVRAFTQRYPVTLVNSLNPHRIEGQKTAASRSLTTLATRRTSSSSPWATRATSPRTGGASASTPTWAGRSLLPRMMGYQAEGAAPIVRGEPIAEPSTVASAIRIGNPASWEQALAARDQSGGVIDSVTDDEILSAYRMLSRQEGIFGEPASAASVAGVIKLSRQLDLSQKRVVCVITGSGLKDPDLASQNVDVSLQELPPEVGAMEKVLEEVVQGSLSLGPRA